MVRITAIVLVHWKVMESEEYMNRKKQEAEIAEVSILIIITIITIIIDQDGSDRSGRECKYRAYKRGILPT